MGKSFAKNAIQQTAIYSIGLVARRVSTVLLTPLFTRYLSPTQYGIVDLLDMMTNLLTLLLGVRIGDALMYFYSKADDERARNRVISTAVAGSIAAGILAAAICGFGARPLSTLLFGSDEYSYYVRLAGFNLLVTFPIEVMLLQVRVTRGAALFVRLSLYRLVAQAGIAVILMVGFGFRIDALLLGQLVGAVWLFGYLIWDIVSRCGAAVDLTVLRSQLQYSWPLVIYGLGMFVIHQGDRVFLRTAVSLGEIGTYALAYKLAMMIGQIHAPFDRYWRIEAFELAKRADASKIFSRTFSYLMFALTSSAVLIVVFLRPVLTVFAGPEFRSADRFVPILIAAYVIRAAGDQLRTVLRTDAATRKEAGLTMWSMVLCLIAYAVLIPQFGTLGASWATFVAFCGMLFLSYRAAQKVRPFEFELSRIVRLGGIATIVGLGAYYLKPDGLGMQIGAGLGFMTLYLALIAASGLIEPDERQSIGDLALRFQRRLPAWARASTD